METETFITCSCQHCAGLFEIPTEYLGLLHECPHCHEETVIFEAPEPEPPAPEQTVSDQSKAPVTEAAYPVARNERTALGMVLSAIGWLIALPAAFMAFIAAQILYEAHSHTPFRAEDSAVAGDAFGWGIGSVIALIFAARLVRASKRHGR